MPPPSRRSPRRAVAVLAAALAALTTGCVRVYQPMSGLQAPRVVDPRAPNLPDVALDVYCVPGDDLRRDEAALLCRRVGALFEVQGARVQTRIQDRRSLLEEDALAGAEAPAPAADAPPRTELIVELRSRELHRGRHPVSWILCSASLTIFPGTAEETFAQDVVVRDSSGFLLARESLQGRLVTSFGAGVWLGNHIADLGIRSPEEKLSGDRANRDLTADLYGQLSQIVFNAKLQAQVLAETPGVPAAGSPP